MLEQHNLAEIVGNWIWLTFNDIPSQIIRARLSQFGFHWNNVRKCWQHPCGQITAGTPKDPREKYETYYPAQTKHA